MKRFLLILLSSFLITCSKAQSKTEISFTVSIDTCTLNGIPFPRNTSLTEIKCKDVTEIIPLLKKGDAEIGIKFYTNHIKEDRDSIVIIKYNFYSKEKGEWIMQSSSGYINLEDISRSDHSKTTITVGNEKTPAFYITCYIGTSDY